MEPLATTGPYEPLVHPLRPIRFIGSSGVWPAKRLGDLAVVLDVSHQFAVGVVTISLPSVARSYVPTCAMIDSFDYAPSSFTSMVLSFLSRTIPSRAVPPRGTAARG